MLSDWYFCTALRLPPQQTAAHLELLRVLRDGQQPAEVVGDDVLTEAIRMLAEAGPWRILHALPVALAAQQARQDPQITEAVTGCCTEMLDSCVRSSRPRDWLYDLLRRLLDGASSGDLAADLADRAERLLGGHPVTAPATPYLDLVEQAVPTIVLIVLDALSRRDPAAVRHWCLEDNRPLWLTRVLDGNYGRQALLLAVTVIARVGDKKAHAFLEAPSVFLRPGG